MPFSADDIPRLERPPGLIRSWSKASVDAQRTEAKGFTACLATSTASEASWPTAKRVDVRLIRSLLARMHWELDLNRRWQRDPGFYLEQALTPLLELLAEPPPVDGARASELLSRLRNIPALLKDGAVEPRQWGGPVRTARTGRARGHSVEDETRRGRRLAVAPEGDSAERCDRRI